MLPKILNKVRPTGGTVAQAFTGNDDAKNDEQDSAAVAVPKRGNWSSRTEFVLSCLGYAVGLGNVWRFPYLVYKWGGGAFLVVYSLILVLVAFPLFAMELAIGQFSSQGPVVLFRRLMPAFEGFGYATVISQFICATYYNAIFAWALFYLGSSMQTTMPWQTCGASYNSPDCFALPAFKQCEVNESFFFHKGRCYDESTVGALIGRAITCYYSNPQSDCGVQLIESSLGAANSSQPILSFCSDYDVSCARHLIVQFDANTKYASEEYFNEFLNAAGVNFNDLKGIHYQVVLAFAVAWILVGLGLVWGPKGMGKIVWVTAVFPMIMILVFVFYGASLDGRRQGYDFYLSTNWSKLAEAALWQEAAGQIFFSLSIGGGGLMTLASYNRFENDIMTDAVIVTLGDALASFISGFGIFAIMGNMASQVGLSVGDVLKGPSHGIAFVAYAHATGGMPAGHLWAILFFLMLALLAIDSEFTMVETVATFIYDEWPVTRRRKWLVIFGLSAVMFLLGVPNVTRGGLQFVGFVDDALFNFCILLLSLAELVCIMYFYGVCRFASDVSMMLGCSCVSCGRNRRGNLFWNPVTKPYWIVCWCFLCPSGIVLIMGTTWYDYAMNPDLLTFAGSPETPIAAKFLFWVIAVGIIVVCVPAAFAYNVFVKHVPLREMFRPLAIWGPADDVNRTGRYAPIQKFEFSVVSTTERPAALLGAANRVL